MWLEGVSLVKDLVFLFKEHKQAKDDKNTWENVRNQQESYEKRVNTKFENHLKNVENKQAEQRSWIKKACIVTVIISFFLSVAIKFFPDNIIRDLSSLSKCNNQAACADDKDFSEVKLYIKK